MKLQVEHENGDVETLELAAGEWRVQEGKHLHRIVGPGGLTHFFTHEGFYDGWGAGVCGSPAHANDVLDALEEKRVVSPKVKG